MFYGRYTWWRDASAGLASRHDHPGRSSRGAGETPAGRTPCFEPIRMSQSSGSESAENVPVLSAHAREFFLVQIGQNQSKPVKMSQNDGRRPENGVRGASACAKPSSARPNGETGPGPTAIEIRAVQVNGLLSPTLSSQGGGEKRPPEPGRLLLFQRQCSPAPWLPSEGRDFSPGETPSAAERIGASLFSSESWILPPIWQRDAAITRRRGRQRSRSARKSTQRREGRGAARRGGVFRRSLR